MKQIVFVATEKEYAEFLRGNVEKYLHSYADFAAYSIEEVMKMEILDADFVLFSAFSFFSKVRHKISKRSEVIVVSVALTKKQVEMLNKIPSGTKALLVNFNNRACMHTIACMYDAGVRDLELIPYSGGDYDQNIKVAITPNEAHLVPKGIETVYNVGESSVDLNSLYNIADKLGVYEEFSSKEANEARKEYYYINSSLDKLLGEKESAIDKMSTLIKLMNEGIIITDALGRIYLTNEKADKLLAERSSVLRGFNITEIFPELDVNSTKEKLIKTAAANLIVSSVEIRSNEEVNGHIITITDFEETEEKQHGIRSKMSEINHLAQFHFEDILGTSSALTDAVANARQIANSDGAVMIIGESGTGKEMFAQSIHNGSRRRKYNFVAVNCAAIPENLLESEMFGYEEGSFTGARKGGKMGFFELAHKGTIFLDEIGEMPLQLQSKLLRVLEEKKVMRVGGFKNIDVDVRIVSATNKNLFEMVEQGTFREDLYYRLNVLPLQVPPLREREDDVLTIFYAFAQKMNASMQLSPEASQRLKQYPWRGNVRELRNVVEYLASRGKKYIELEELPPMRDKQKPVDTVSKGLQTSTLIDQFILNEGREITLYYAVLRHLQTAYEQGIRLGRQRLLEEINQSGGFYTEGEIRKALAKLSAYGFIRSAKGRGGSAMNPEGLRLLTVIEDFRNRGIVG